MDTRTHLTAAEVCERLRISRSTFYAWLKANQLDPVRPIRIGPRAVRYTRTSVETFEAAAAERGAKS